MSLTKDWNSGGSNEVRGTGSPSLRDLMNGLTGLADITAVKALDLSERSDGMLVRVSAAGGQQLEYKYVAASTLTGDDLLVLTPADAPTAGRWVANRWIDLKLAVGFAKADAAVLYTVPVGFTLQLGVPWWEVTTSWTGGTNSAIGLSSSNAGLSTKGDLLGGAGGDVAATIVSTGALAKGTVGAQIGKPPAVLQAGDTIRFDRVVDAFTAGAGFAHVPVHLLATP